MNKYLEFEESVLKTLSKCKVKIELYHLHFTIRNSDIKEIELKDDRIEVIKIHRMRLTPTITQYQTVYKNSLLSKIFDVAKKLFTLESIDLIGYKLECIVKYNLENIVNFPKFNYVELHFKKIDFKDFHNQSQKQLISYSYDNDCIVNAIRFPDDKSREEIFKDIEKWISFFNSTKPNNIEISIYDGWSDNIEIDWIKLNDENCVNNMISLLSKNV
jgi:hypothetical protein